MPYRSSLRILYVSASDPYYVQNYVTLRVVGCYHKITMEAEKKGKMSPLYISSTGIYGNVYFPIVCGSALTFIR